MVRLKADLALVGGHIRVEIAISASGFRSALLLLCTGPPRVHVACTRGNIVACPIKDVRRDVRTHEAGSTQKIGEGWIEIELGQGAAAHPAGGARIAANPSSGEV